MPMDKKTIGRRERVNFSEWKLRQVSCKVDTGAYTSSIHCEYTEEKEVDGKRILFFKVLAPEDKKYNGKLLQAVNYSRKKVKNSFGQEEIRYKVTTKVTMFGEQFEADFTLTDRSKMRFPILLGRKLIHGRFLVDVEKVNLSKKK
jgi:hypothetical protein